MFYKGPFSRFLSYHRIEVTFCEEKVKLSGDFLYLLFMQACLGFQTSQLASICSEIRICVWIMKIFDWEITVSSPFGSNIYSRALFFFFWIQEDTVVFISMNASVRRPLCCMTIDLSAVRSTWFHPRKQRRDMDSDFPKHKNTCSGLWKCQWSIY